MVPMLRLRDENKPILLSVGYSACHWCHVMAHESFEHESTAEVMNKLFVNIKVDREERPDIDKIYQTAHQLMTQRAGGWPLTVFLTPGQQLPFFAGTYFPSEARHGMPAFTELLMAVAQHFEQKQDEVLSQGAAVIEALGKVEPDAADPSNQLDRRPTEKLRAQLASNFDEEWGGFGGAPKFPHPTSLEFLLRHWRRTAHSETPDMDALFLSTPIKFSGRLKQVVGRVLRPLEGKEPLVYDYIDSHVGLLEYQAKQRHKVFAQM